MTLYIFFTDAQLKPQNKTIVSSTRMRFPQTNNMAIKPTIEKGKQYNEKEILKLKEENTICKESLKKAEFELAHQKYNRQDNHEDAIFIDEEMPDELQETLAIYSAHFNSEDQASFSERI
jgi:hypothetical protein